jgi:hypothetical protein
MRMLDCLDLDQDSLGDAYDMRLRIKPWSEGTKNSVASRLTERPIMHDVVICLSEACIYHRKLKLIITRKGCKVPIYVCSTNRMQRRLGFFTLSAEKNTFG